MPISFSMRLAALPEVMVQYIGDEAVIPNAKTRACVGLIPSVPASGNC